MKEIIFNNNIKLSDKQNIGNITKYKFADNYKQSSDRILYYLAELTSAKENIKQIINADVIYRAEIPIDIMNKLKSGEYSIMESKNGQLLSNIIDTTKPKNRNIVHQIRLCEDLPDINSNIQTLMNNVTNMALQRQIAGISNQLEECNEKLNCIQQGQLIDRLAKIYSAQDQIEQAFKMDDKDNDINICLIGAISNLNEGRKQLMLSLEKNKEFIDNIPDNNFKFFCKNLFDTNYKRKYEDVYNNGQIVFKGIIESSILLAIAYDKMGQKDVISSVFNPLNQILYEYSDRFCKLESIISEDMIKYKDTWYRNPKKIEYIAKNFKRDLLIENLEKIQIEFKGEELIKIMEE